MLSEKIENKPNTLKQNFFNYNTVQCNAGHKDKS